MICHFSPENLNMDGTEKSHSEIKLYSRLRLWEFPEKYIFEPVDTVADSYLSVNRADGSMNLIGSSFLYNVSCQVFMLRFFNNFSGMGPRMCKARGRAEGLTY